MSTSNSKSAEECLVAAILYQVRLDGFVAKIGPTGEDRQQQVAGIQRIVLV